MNIRGWRTIRYLLLGVTAIGVFLAIGKSVISPSSSEIIVQPYPLPASVPLAEWKFLSSQEVESDNARLYRYGQGSVQVIIHLQYVPSALSNQKKFDEHSPVSGSNSEAAHLIRHHSRTGHYSLSLKQEPILLKSCINPRGPSVITYQQFIANRHTYDFQPQRFISWLLGNETLRDHRCLWTEIKIKTELASPEEAYPILEKVWLSWYEFWESNFPST